ARVREAARRDRDEGDRGRGDGDLDGIRRALLRERVGRGRTENEQPAEHVGSAPHGPASFGGNGADPRRVRDPPSIGAVGPLDGGRTGSLYSTRWLNIARPG